MRLRVKLLVLAGLCAVLLGIGNQRVRAGCSWGYITWSINGGSYYSYDTGCWRDDGPVQEGAYCTQQDGAGNCWQGVVYYNCGCS